MRLVYRKRKGIPMRHNALFILLIAAVVFISGCTGSNIDVTPIVNTSSEVQQFLLEHPNADIKASLWSESAVNRSIDDIRKDCPQMDVQELWNVKINEGFLSIDLWLDSNKQPICVLKDGSNVSEVNPPAIVPNISASPAQPILNMTQQLVCPQVITSAVSSSGECKKFSTPCEVPDRWTKTDSCIINETTDTFAKCLTLKGAKMYGTEGCLHCKSQKELFGNSFKYIDYIECTERKTECKDAGIYGYPTWIINEVKYAGERDLDTLAKISDCPIYCN